MVPTEFGARPRDDELDLFGITHAGKVRHENQDHFLVATVHPELIIHETSLPSPQSLEIHGTRLATVMLVADGVGGSAGGREASQLAIETIMRYVSSIAALLSRGRVIQRKRVRGRTPRGNARGTRGRSRRITAETGIEPDGDDAHAVHRRVAVGVCRAGWGQPVLYYQLDGKLRRLTRDQTIAQDLVDQGVLDPERAAMSPLSNVLASAIGAEAALPEVSRVEINNRGVFLLCSDGLTKHVTDEEIGAELKTLGSSEQSCRRLLELALERGGTDNVTVLIARVRNADSPEDGPGS